MLFYTREPLKIPSIAVIACVWVLFACLPVQARQSGQGDSTLQGLRRLFVVDFKWNHQITDISVIDAKTGEKEPDGQVRQEIVSAAEKVISSTISRDGWDRAYGSMPCALLDRNGREVVNCPWGSEWEVHDPEAESPLMLAVRRDDAVLVKRLLAEEVNVNSVDQGGFSVLMQAADYAGPATIKVLLENGANVNAKAKNGSTPLILAACREKEEIVEVLLEAHADVNAMNLDGETALFGAAQCDRLQTASLLLNRGANVNIARVDGLTPLMTASINASPDMVALLLARGADAGMKKKDGRTALNLAEHSYKPNQKTIELLKSWNAVH